MQAVFKCKEPRNPLPARKCSYLVGETDSKIVLKLVELIMNSAVDHKLATFGDIVYKTSQATIGVKPNTTYGCLLEREEGKAI
ncbi:hypothetical protein PoB_004431100 [Plakobranchus ocellatus]|uniref:Uncharacterized protein n=1 Tax=Plakobranchus ocellatus TaxID=259542 RepID=A0AAV4BG35_9GAST|nr:hypothetical protein PoB_004431100 [Plakobranchus ocellatus]